METVQMTPLQFASAIDEAQRNDRLAASITNSAYEVLCADRAKEVMAAVLSGHPDSDELLMEMARMIGLNAERNLRP